MSCSLKIKDVNNCQKLYKMSVRVDHLNFLTNLNSESDKSFIYMPSDNLL